MFVIALIDYETNETYISHFPVPFAIKYTDKAGRGTMIAAIGTIIVAYDNNNSGTRYTPGHHGVIENEGSGGVRGRMKRGRLMEVRNVFRRRQQVKWQL